MNRESIKRFLAPFVENIAESSAACLITMVQGNLLAITISHWLIASQTGLFAGTLATVLLFLWRASKPWVVAVVLGVATALVDYLVHPGQFGPVFFEALVTGAGAAALCYVVGWVFRRVRDRRRARGQKSEDVG